MTQQDLNDLAWPAMRYALGRMTYVVESVTECLIRNAKEIPNDTRFRMAQEIEHAIKRSEAGMTMDIEQWKKVLISFEEVANKK